MPDTNHADGNHSKSDKAFKHDTQPGLWRIAFVVIILIVGLLVVSVYHPNMSERVKFFTANLLSLLILVVVVVQAIIYKKQWDAMQQQRDAMQRQLDAMMYGQRAYLTISSINRKSDEPIAAAKFELNVENSGNTPASTVEIFDTGGIRRCWPVPEILPSKWTQLGVIAPQRHTPHVFDATKEMGNLHTSSSSGTGTYHRQGIIHYRDIFGDLHSTKFCFELTQEMGLKWSPCKEGGNEAN